MSLKPTISAIICTRNRPQLIAGAVQSVLDNDSADFELVVVDQSDGDDTASVLAVFSSDARFGYIHTTKIGLSSAYNTAIGAAAGGILAFTDDDCRARVDWLSTIRSEFDGDPGADLLYGNVEAPDGWQGPGVIPELRFSERARIDSRETFKIVGMGADFAARRRAFQRAGNFDEVLGGGGPLRSSQDFDLQYRLFRASGVTILSPAVRVTHYGLRTGGEWPATLHAYGVGDGGFYMKHIRCGDVLAARLLTGRIARESVKALTSPVLHRRRHCTAYLRGMLRGSRDSFNYRVDRNRRLYVQG